MVRNASNFVSRFKRAMMEFTQWVWYSVMLFTIHMVQRSLSHHFPRFPLYRVEIQDNEGED